MGKEGVVIVIQAQNGIQKILIADEAVVFRIILRLQHVGCVADNLSEAETRAVVRDIYAVLLSSDMFEE